MQFGYNLGVDKLTKASVPLFTSVVTSRQTDKHNYLCMQGYMRNMRHNAEEGFCCIK